MPKVSGPHNSELTHADGNWVRATPPLESPAITLGEALDHYAAAFNVLIRPCVAPLPGESEIKYFEIADAGGETESIVDIHIVRDAFEICPKQDLFFPLLQNDLVEIGPLAC